MSARNPKKAAANQIENQLEIAEKMLASTKLTFTKKGSALLLKELPLSLYYDNIGKKFIVLAVKTGAEIHENKFIGGVKKFLETFNRGESTGTTEEVKAPTNKKEAPVKTKEPGTKKASGGVSKTELARAIFVKMFGKKGVARKDIIEQFIKDAGLTKAGASTYYQNFVKQNGVK